MKKILVVLLIIFGVMLIIAPDRAKDSSPIEKTLGILEKNNKSLRRFVLENGMTCLIKEDHSAPVVSIQFWIGTGSIHEQEYLGSGLSHAIEHMIFKGTPTRKPGDITREINDVGGYINAYTSYDRTVFHTDLPSRNWKTGLATLSDALINTLFPEEEWNKEKEVILREIAMGKDDPDRVLSKLLFLTAYTVHPYKYPVIGYEDTLKAISRDDLVSFFRRNYVSDNVILVIVGDINQDDVEKEIAVTFAKFKRQSRNPAVLSAEPEQVSPRFLREYGEYKKSRLEWVYHTVGLSNPDAPALDVLAEIVGQGRSSRLVNRIKEQQKLVHSISAWSYTPREPGLFGISAELDPEKENQTIEAIQAEINSWLNSPFNDSEVNKAKRQILNSQLSSLETVKGQANNYASGEFYAADPRYDETYLKELNNITPLSLMNVAKKYLIPEGRSIVILAPETSRKMENKGDALTANRQPVERKNLSNGIPLLIGEDHRLPFVYICAAFNGGLLSENTSNAGITELMSSLLTRGTKKRSSEEIALMTESLGGSLTYFSGRNSFGLQAKCLSADVETFMSLLCECLSDSVFPQQEIDKQKEIQIAEIDAQREQPFEIASASLRKMIFHEHPYGSDPLGTKDSVTGISRAAVMAHASKTIVTGNMVISIFGDIKADTALHLAHRFERQIPDGKAPVFSAKNTPPTLPVRTKQREPKEQAILLMGFPGIDVKSPQYDAVAMLQNAMSGLSSGLATKIREERGLAYYAGAFNISGMDPGMFVLYAGTHESAVDEVEKLMTEEIRRITENGLQPEELERARTQIISNYEREMQNNQSVAMTCALNELYGLGYNHFFTTKERYDALTAEDIRKAAASILSVDKHAVSLVLPAKEETTK